MNRILNGNDEIQGKAGVEMVMVDDPSGSEYEMEFDGVPHYTTSPRSWVEVGDKKTELAEMVQALSWALFRLNVAVKKMSNRNWNRRADAAIRSIEFLKEPVVHKIREEITVLWQEIEFDASMDIQSELEGMEERDRRRRIGSQPHGL